ncbi:hypothetical protein K432DRAFT_409737 [Lepidopterella palustris CBS 459.81]|uniref:Uncharacterized protein n=1 Tax=Lepidopterella palustris CBS 459.81 TaxID=1314670 RepID=A0A8E2DZE3_9PEZI|nr:hypothetical protein K432DRAFT_409737 [Lepidopterella palustris CBS 459.81]
MNDSQRSDQSRMYNGGSADCNLIPLMDINGNPGNKVSKMQSSPTSPSTVYGYAYTLCTWFPEFFCCILGILALIADVIILRQADAQPPTKIIHHITINSLIELITSVAKFAFMVPIVSVLGQLKWLWFKDDARPLADFQLYNNASGGLGCVKFSLRMLFKSPIAWLAAIIALSGSITSPLTQQAIGYISVRQALSNGTATVSRASAMSRTDAMGFKEVQGDDLLIQTAYLTAAYLGPNQTLPGVDPICSSGDCDWPIYGSLGICAEIVNISASTNSSLLSLLLDLFLADFRNSQYATVFAEAGSGPYYLAGLIPFPDPSTEFTEASPQTVISQAFIGYYSNPVNLTNHEDLAKMQYIGVSLYFCTQSFSTTVKGGIQNTSTLAYTNNILSSSTTQSVNSFWNLALYGTPMCGPTITLSGPTGLSHETYLIDFCTAVYLSDVYIIGTSGGILLGLDRSVVDTVGQISQALGIALYGEFNSSAIPDPATQYGNVKFMMENIGKTLTTYMRNEGPTFLNQDNSTIAGIAYAPQTLIHIRWPYISFLAVQLWLTIIVLLFTIVATYRSGIQILKENSLATMCALSQNVKADLGGMQDMKSLKSKAKRMSVRLRRGADAEARVLDV